MVKNEKDKERVKKYAQTNKGKQKRKEAVQKYLSDVGVASRRKRKDRERYLANKDKWHQRYLERKERLKQKCLSDPGFAQQQREKTKEKYLRDQEKRKQLRELRKPKSNNH